MTLGVGDIASEAFHEAGHAVMARLLGLSLKWVRINRAEASGKTYVVWLDARDPRQELRILAAARACTSAFNVDTLHDQGGFGDEAEIQTILEAMFPDEDEAVRKSYIDVLDAELSKLFDRQNVRAAAWVLADILTRAGEIEGPRAEAVIDHHLKGGNTNA